MDELYLPMDAKTQEEWVDYYIKMDPFVGNFFDMCKGIKDENFYKMCFLRKALEVDKMREEKLKNV